MVPNIVKTFNTFNVGLVINTGQVIYTSLVLLTVTTDYS